MHSSRGSQGDTPEEATCVEKLLSIEAQAEENKVLVPHMNPYGLKQSAKAWNKLAKETMAEPRFEQGPADHRLFCRA
ncbi:hypothetical protein M514_22528 [Trichuris suis]|uniref:Uncharacterized protein n=1 Tax=Trichuris suis TaxID=68888 RepID=A0A085N704_9BILA|nr:hypothetical protein M514_00668 [Trichuris suis]KFD65250.1 hypothetical protein M514_22528 [Trichuris suis]